MALPPLDMAGFTWKPDMRLNTFAITAGIVEDEADRLMTAERKVRSIGSYESPLTQPTLGLSTEVFLFDIKILEF